jgi:hypothetical protein
VPWNFPLMNAVWKIAPALACGCTVVLKPAELTPLSALWLGSAALEAGFPAGVLNIVPGFGAEAGAALVSHPGVDKIAFTGSPQTGQSIMRAAAGNLTRIGLELGGKSPSVVFADADLEAAIRQTASGAFFNAGQVCSAATRIIVEDSVHDAFVEDLTRRVKSQRVGNPLDDGTTMGPLISQKQMERVLRYIDAGKSEGAEATCGGGRAGNRGYFVEPTVFSGVTGEMRIAREEIFGPVVAVMRFSEEDEAVELANGTDYSLAGAVWTSDRSRSPRLKGDRFWHGLDQHLRADRCAPSTGRHGRAIRHRSRPRAGRHRELHRTEGGLAADRPAGQGRRPLVVRSAERRPVERVSSVRRPDHSLRTSGAGEPMCASRVFFEHSCSVRTLSLFADHDIRRLDDG